MYVISDYKIKHTKLIIGSPKKFNSGIYDSSVSGSYAASIRQRYASINNQ